jgi:NADPH:quinone reductase-like Zn-dependent oxidoreductase
MRRARDLGIQPLFDYRITDLSQIREHFDVVYDAAGTMTVAAGLGLLRQGGVYLDIHPTPIKFIRAIFNRKLKPVVCTGRADIMDALADAAGSGDLRLPIAETVPLKDAIHLITALEAGRKPAGKALVSM